LTVHKIRKGRNSVMDGSFDGPSEINTGSAITDLIKKQAGKSFPQTIPWLKMLKLRIVSTSKFEANGL